MVKKILAIFFILCLAMIVVTGSFLNFKTTHERSINPAEIDTSNEEINSLDVWEEKPTKIDHILDLLSKGYQVVPYVVPLVRDPITKEIYRPERHIAIELMEQGISLDDFTYVPTDSWLYERLFKDLKRRVENDHVKITLVNRKEMIVGRHAELVDDDGNLIEHEYSEWLVRAFMVRMPKHLERTGEEKSPK